MLVKTAVLVTHGAPLPDFLLSTYMQTYFSTTRKNTESDEWKLPVTRERYSVIGQECSFNQLVLENYNRPPVMALAIPIAVKFLHRGNKELCRNMSNYLSLAAITKADLLADHTEVIVKSILQGPRNGLHSWELHAALPVMAAFVLSHLKLQELPSP
ncbi:hypothetical protein P7K49_031817 [Saguinus oedipus]|uniref:Uncharacterized protein n=1 Tax=Saguinus oedipus TaxID=9490 RepID=A0ABQ9U0H1_SAGOE|nr:hypothetical protein P7K49_031817 [Saguinus oedipus]